MSASVVDLDPALFGDDVVAEVFARHCRSCLICGGPSDTLECDSCVIGHDQKMRRAEDQ